MPTIQDTLPNFWIPNTGLGKTTNYSSEVHKVKIQPANLAINDPNKIENSFTKLLHLDHAPLKYIFNGTDGEYSSNPKSTNKEGFNLIPTDEIAGVRGQILQQIIENNLRQSGSSYKFSSARTYGMAQWTYLYFSSTDPSSSPTVEDFVQKAFGVRPEDIKTFPENPDVRYIHVKKIIEINSDKGLEFGVLSPNESKINKISLLNSRANEFQSEQRSFIADWTIKVQSEEKPGTFVITIFPHRLDAEENLDTITEIGFRRTGAPPPKNSFRLVLAANDQTEQTS